MCLHFQQLFNGCRIVGFLKILIWHMKQKVLWLFSILNSIMFFLYLILVIFWFDFSCLIILCCSILYCLGVVRGAIRCFLQIFGFQQLVVIVNHFGHFWVKVIIWFKSGSQPYKYYVSQSLHLKILTCHDIVGMVPQNTCGFSEVNKHVESWHFICFKMTLCFDIWRNGRFISIWFVSISVSIWKLKSVLWPQNLHPLLHPDSPVVAESSATKGVKWYRILTWMQNVLEVLNHGNRWNHKCLIYSYFSQIIFLSSFLEVVLRK